MHTRPTTFTRLTVTTSLAALLALGVGCGAGTAADVADTTVATLNVTPKSAALSTGDTVKFNATAFNAAGDVLTGDSVVWSTTSSTIASVTPDGVARGGVAGAATIRANVGGITGVVGDATVNVSAPPTTTGFGNEPAGFVLRGEWKNSPALIANGWYDDGNPSGWGNKSRVTTGYAGSPRIGGLAAIQTFYAGGVDGGHDAGRMQFNLPAGTREIFFGAEVQFKADYPTSTSSGGNKQFFVTFTGGGRYFVNLDDGLAAGRWGIYQQSTPLLDSNIPVAYGSWIKMEWYLKSGAGDGIMRLWLDGVLAINLTNLTFPAGDMVLAYDDGSNNGNHYPLGSDPRKIGRNLGGPVDAYRWVSVLHVSTPP